MLFKKLDLLTNATVIDDAIGLYLTKSNDKEEQVKSSSSSDSNNEDNKESEPDYDDLTS